VQSVQIDKIGLGEEVAIDRCMDLYYILSTVHLQSSTAVSVDPGGDSRRLQELAQIRISIDSWPEDVQLQRPDITGTVRTSLVRMASSGSIELK